MKKRLLAMILAALLAASALSAMAETRTTDMQARSVDVHKKTGAMAVRPEGEDGYVLMNADGKVLINQRYLSMYPNGDTSYFKVEGPSEDGVHNDGLIDSTGRVIVPAEYADLEIVSDRWQMALKLVEATSEDNDYTFTNFSSGEKFFYRIDTVDVYFDGAKIGELGRSDYGGSSRAYGAYICVQNRERERVYYNSRLEKSPYESQNSGEYDSVYNRGKTTYYHQGTGQIAFVPECTLTEDEVEQAYLFDSGKVYDLQGNEVFKTPQGYDNVRDFSGGYAVVSLYGKKGMMNLAGEEILPPEYDQVGNYEPRPYEFGYISAVKDGRLGFLDLAGNVTCDFTYNSDTARNYGTFATIKDLDGTTIVLSAAVGELPERFADTTTVDYEGSRVLVVQDAEGNAGLLGLNGEMLIPFSEGARYIYACRDGSVAVADLGSRQYRLYQFDEMVMPEPGTRASAAADAAWTCSNGHEGNTGNFCAECGEPRPAADEPAVCAACGHVFAEGESPNFCPECGAKQG